jgi:hypothetical protein
MSLPKLVFGKLGWWTTQISPNQQLPETKDAIVERVTPATAAAWADYIVDMMGLRLGAKYFITDIEAPSPSMDTPADHNFELLGFQHLYLRSNYGV